MSGWTEYAVALALFVGSHFLPRLGLRDRMIGVIGRRAYFSLYGLLSLALFVWIISAAGRAPYVELWPQMPWTRWVPSLAVPVAFVLLVVGAGLRQPFTLGGRRKADPGAEPGLAALSRHPHFLALALWAGAHLFPNGDLAHVILFGSFALMPLAAIPAFDAKARRELGEDQAAAFFARRPLFSLAPLSDPAWRRANGTGLALRVLIGLALWLGALFLHGAIIGVSPFPA